MAARPRLRFAPSPTGYLHVGGARTVLFNWLVARRTGGEMLLRIEDTDAERNRPELTDDILEQIQWLGLGWDGEPVHQSERLHLYAKAADQLLAAGRAYWCDCTPEQVQRRAAERGGPPGYDGHCRDRGLERGPGTALRFRVPDEGVTTFDDLVRGRVSFDNGALEDFVLLRSNGIPTFLLANVVDDADMGITHVVRGEEHVNGTPKYLLIGEALGLDHRPVFAHLPVLVNEQRKKLSKRRDSVSVAEFRAAGYLPEAMVNYLALLGWGPPDGVEIRPLDEIVELFRLEDVNPSPAFFDTRKLQHFNAEYIRKLDADAFVARARPFFTHAETEAAVRPLAELVRDRVRLLSEVEPMVDFLLTDDISYDEASWRKHVAKHGERSAAMLDAATRRLEDCEWRADAIEAALLAAAEDAGFVNPEGRPQMSKAQGPVRVAVTGRGVGPPLYESLVVLGRGRTLDRLRAARAAL
ncbi:MAG TPA: glutamate--tRNA ligase [Acidimicrobiales bacterium]|jgi:glutamyl-tRNA synthetase|nr:glutamate--tRNA ligase [Acidimicrobiales bacterium]